MNKKKILVLCTGNSCRSQMAHGFLKQYPELEVYSAGVETHGLNQKAVLTMAEVGIDISGHKSTLVDDLLHIQFDELITVCDHAAEVCPVFPFRIHKTHHSFSDPSKVKGSPEEINKAFRDVRDEIAAFCKDFHQKLISKG